MDWTAAEIVNASLRWYEKAAIRARKRSNRYTAFVRCACKEYRTSDDEHKSHLILSVMGLELFPTDVSCRILLTKCWQRMTDERKQAWKDRADMLNSLPRTGEFNCLPSNAPIDSESELLICLRMECDNITNRLSQFLQKSNIALSTQNKRLCIPHKAKVGMQIYVYPHISMSAYLRRRIFGERLSNVKESYLRSTNSKNDPGYVHFNTIECADEVLCLSDVRFARAHNLEHDRHFVFTSYAILVNNLGQSFKVYGWKETFQRITFIYCDDDDTPGIFIDMPIPNFVTTGTGRSKQRSYEFPLAGGLNYVYQEFHPVCLSITSTKMDNIRILAPRFCYWKDHDGSIFMISAYST